MGDELLFENDRTRIRRITGTAARTIIGKEFLGPEADRRLQHESAVLRRISGLPGVPHLLQTDEVQASLTLRDENATALPAGPLEVDHLVELAVSLAEVIAGLHARGVVHKDINPANIMMVGPTSPVLIDYDLATTFPVERPRFTHHTDIVGTLNYLAPEQSGRTGWPVDQRADLYAFGATLYELATGGPVFAEDDPLRLVYAHLTQTPALPSAVRPGLPPMLDEIIGRLLQKDPERRYQSAEGVRHDLRRLRDLGAAGAVSVFPLGERDFPLELSAPTHAVGRAAAVATLTGAFSDAISGGGRAVLVSGAAGVGKTTVIDELRLPVTSAGGWFVTGKFDQYRQDADADGMRHAFRGLGKMLLAEPEEELIAIRERLHEALGVNAGLVAAVLPEFAALLQVEPHGDVQDPLRAGQQLKQSGLQVLRALGDPRRPIVIVVDDLQWAHAGPIGLIDAVVTDPTLTGVLFVGAYRDSEVDGGHPLSAVMSRWQGYPVPPPHVQLENLAPTDVAELVTEMLRAPVAGMAALVTALARHTGGNPFEVVEFLNAMRRAQVLRPTADGWTFDSAAVENVIGRADVLSLLADRVAALPERTRGFIKAVSCLGGDVALDVLTSAGISAGVSAGISAGAAAAESGDVMPLLTPALEAGLLLLDTVDGVVRFRHDRVRQAVYDGLSDAQRGQRHLELARRLAGTPDFRMIAAEQYQAALTEVVDPVEAGQVAELFHDAAAHARQLANYPLVERFLRTAIALTGPDHEALRWRLEGQYQIALVALGRFDDAAIVHQRIDREGPDLIMRTTAARIQMGSLIMQNRSAEALELGCIALNGLGYPVPAGEELAQQNADSCDELAAWVAQTSAQEPVPGRGSDATTEAVSRILTTLIQAAFFVGSPLLPWLVVSAARIWSRNGPSIALLSPLGHAAFVTIASRDDFRTGHDVVRRVLTAAETINHEPDSSFVQLIYAMSCGPWFDPLQDSVQAAREAHERLARAADLYSAGCTYYVSVPLLLECAETVSVYQAEIERGLEFAAATGNNQLEGYLIVHRRLAARLSDETQDDTGPPFAVAERPEIELGVDGTPDEVWHLGWAVEAMLLNDPVALARHAASAGALIVLIQATPPIIMVHLVQAVSLVIQAQRPDVAEKVARLAEFDQHRDWIARRAEDAPGNFHHLVVWLDAERAWADGRFETSLRGFDTAQREADARQRPWQRALIAERRARFLLQHGIEHAARTALREACRRYEQWGAARKVAALRHEFPFLTAVDGTAAPSLPQSSTSTIRQGSVSSQNIDLMAVLRASQAISSETRLDRLTEQVGQVLCELTGANSAHLLLHDEETSEWRLLHADGQMQPISSAITAGLLPATVIRYVERTGEPLLVDDATRDDRFAQDPYLRPLQQCALLTLPVFSGGQPTAMLLLENRDTRGAFGSNRLDTVLLLAGQLAVALGNAMLYTALERKVAERTRDLEAANTQLELLAVTDPLTGLPNRRRLSDSLTRQWQEDLTHSMPVSIAMIDIDHFKKYNDHYGHPAGDECLRLVAAAISRSVRESDVVIRYGGEEFAILLADADQPTAARVTERVRAAVADLALPHELTESKRVTVSIGVATSMPATISPEDLLSSADTFLYEAKKGGRNRVASGAPENR